jgi:hypothetical protein
LVLTARCWIGPNAVIKPLVIDQTTTAATLQQVLKMTYELLGINQSVPEYSDDDVAQFVVAVRNGNIPIGSVSNVQRAMIMACLNKGMQSITVFETHTWTLPPRVDVAIVQLFLNRQAATNTHHMPIGASE